MKHAWLIIAHNNINQLHRLVNFLDHECNDIFIHMDKKFQEYNFLDLKKIVTYAGIYETDKRLSVTWGGWTQCKCELCLLEKMVNNHRKYDYVHLLSNGDVPVKSWAYMENFFEQNAGMEFLSYGRVDDYNELFHRCGAFHFLQDVCGRNRKVLRAVDRILFRFQKAIGINRLKQSDVVWYKGSNWFSITGECAGFVYSKEKWAKKHFEYSFCCDEVMVNTIVANSKYRKNVYLGGKSGKQDQRSSLRYVDWVRGKGNSPHLFTMDDKDALVSAGKDLLFARKFDETVDAQIIDFLYDKFGKTERNAGKRGN